MSSQPDRILKIELNVKASEPELLEGLDAWVRLGLLSDDRVRQLGQKYLCRPLPEPAIAKVEEAGEGIGTIHNLELSNLESPSPSVSESGDPLSRLLRSLMAELSVRWLLLLGVFMVVVSSGVLAASQWERFLPAGQYLILFAYTVIFWGVSQWAARQSNLVLTAQTLQWVTLLLVPVNFWAMDGFGLWHSIFGWIAIAIAAPILTAITLRGQNFINVLLSAFYLLPCYLHWGWKFSSFPLVAVYGGMTVISLATVYHKRSRSPLEILETQDRQRVEMDSSLRSRIWERFTLPETLMLLYAAAVLLARAIFIVGVPIDRLGLAIGMAGWILVRSRLVETQNVPSVEESPVRRKISKLIVRLGAGLLFLGWGFSVWTQPGQAIAVSGLALWWLSDRLRRFFQVSDLLGIFAIALQAYWLIRGLIPPVIRTSTIATGTQLVRAQENPWVLLGITLFPYLLLMVWLIDWLYRRPQSDLERGARNCAVSGDRLSLGFGVFLTLLSLPNSPVRSVNLILSTLTLASVTYRRLVLGINHSSESSDLSGGYETGSHPHILVYLTHISGLLTLFSMIDWLLPDLRVGAWALILLTFAIAEWLVSLYLEVTRQNARLKIQNSFLQTAWQIGLFLASFSYHLFFIQNNIELEGVKDFHLGLFWLLTPIALTVVAKWARDRRQLATGLSVGALGLVQLLTWNTPETRLLGLGIATALMVFNTRYLQQTTVAAITIGFGLCFSIQGLAIGVLGWPPVSGEGWLVAGAIAIAFLSAIHAGLIRRFTLLSTIYARATDGWTIAIGILELSVLTVHSFSVYLKLFFPSVAIVSATLITLVAIAYRTWKQPHNWGIYALGWSIELLAAETLGFFGRSLINLAIANIVLGLSTQIIGDLWNRRTGRILPSSWNVIPLLYGLIGLGLRWGTFTSWTGLTTLGLVLIAIGIGRRSPEGKPLVYLALMGVSLSAYELVYYHIATLPLASRLTAIATLGAGIMYDYRLLTPWLKDYMRLTSKELKTVADLHWGLSSCILCAIALTDVESSANAIQSSNWVAIGTGIFLTNYAIMEGRDNPHLKSAEIWVSLGILEGAGITAYLLSHLPGNVQDIIFPWVGAIACLVAYFFYFLPWESWGWPQRPWRITAIALPAIAVLVSSTQTNIGTDGAWYLSTVMAAAFYLFLSKVNRQIHLTYLSVILIDWVLLHCFWNLELSDPLWYITPGVFSVLYFAQVEPTLKKEAQKETRHLLRILALGTLCFAVLLTHHWIKTGILSIFVIFAGLGLRIRAFLYVGTVVFLLNAIEQLIVLNSLYSFIRWIVGLLVGIAFMWIAATFETRREQIVTLLQNWLVELENWE